jgi:hypothetical protein
MGALIAVVVVVITFLALVHAIVFSETLNLICLLLLAIAIAVGGIPVGWWRRP